MPTITLTGSGSWTVPANVHSVRVEMVGGGGARSCAGASTTRITRAGTAGGDTTFGTLRVRGGAPGIDGIGGAAVGIAAGGATGATSGFDFEVAGEAGTLATENQRQIVTSLGIGRGGARDVVPSLSGGNGGPGFIRSSQTGSSSTGGGGGAYGRANAYATTPGSSISYSVGAGGSPPHHSGPFCWYTTSPAPQAGTIRLTYDPTSKRAGTASSGDPSVFGAFRNTAYGTASSGDPSVFAQVKQLRSGRVRARGPRRRDGPQVFGRFKTLRAGIASSGDPTYRARRTQHIVRFGEITAGDPELKGRVSDQNVRFGKIEPEYVNLTPVYAHAVPHHGRYGLVFVGSLATLAGPETIARAQLSRLVSGLVAAGDPEAFAELPPPESAAGIASAGDPELTARPTLAEFRRGVAAGADPNAFARATIPEYAAGLVTAGDPTYRSRAERPAVIAGAIAAGAPTYRSRARNAGPPPAIAGAPPMVGWILHIDGIGHPPQQYRIWSGTGTLTFDGEEWLGVDGANGAFVEVSPISDEVGGKAARVTASVAVPPEAVREMLEVDVGPAAVRQAYIYSLDNGSTWTAAPVGITGQLSRPEFQAGVYSVEIETWAGDADRGQPRMWSHETQETYYPGDKGFEFMRDLDQGIEARWPP